MLVRALALVAVAAAFAAPVTAQPARTHRTPWGSPDLQGVWTNISLTPLERSPEFKTLVIPEAEAAAFDARRAGPPPNRPTDDVGGNETEWFDHARLARIGGEARTSWVVEPADGRVPYTPEARRKFEERTAPKPTDDDNPEALGLAERCLIGLNSTSGPPMMNARYNAHYQILQTLESVVILVEMNHDARIIRLGDRRHPPSHVRLWMGDSVGWWEGDTLVVETTNLHPEQSFRAGRQARFYLSADARVMERFTRTSKDQIRYEFSIDDPVVFARPWRAEMPLNAATGPLHEYACHEGNYSMTGILAGGRAEDAARSKAAQADSARGP